MTKNGVANGTRGLPRQACMSCAQKKIRCDGERPCGRCRSALQECHDQPARVRPPGVKMRRIPRACPACIRAKARCELQRPCERCVKHGKGHLCDNPPRVPQRPGPLIPVKNALNEFMPTPEFVRDFFLRSHRYYSVDYVRSLPELRRMSFYRTIRLVLSVDDIGRVQDDIDGSAGWPIESFPKQERRVLVLIPDSVPTISFVFSSDGDTITSSATVNDAAVNLLGFVDDDFVSHSSKLQDDLLGMFMPKVFRIFHPDDLHHILEQAAREWFGCENPVFTPVLRCIDRNGRLVNVQVSWHSFTHVERLDPLEVSHNVIMTFEVQQ
ncbi:Zn(2)-C6 fungal-type domain-containing protein [Plasmodiophora brassicae]